MKQPRLPRFEVAARREFLKRAATIGAIALVPGALAACSKDDKDVFAGAEPGSSPSADVSTTAPGGDATTTSSATSATGTPLPDGAQLEVAFTYAVASDGFGPARNPFIAVWVESAAGDLVATISLWYNPPKGDRWINHLSNWYATDSAHLDAGGTDDVESVTGATRPAGSYTVLWDGLDTAGVRAPQGDYVVCIESAREHGPASFASTALTLGASPVDATFDDDGELTSGTASYTV